MKEVKEDPKAIKETTNMTDNQNNNKIINNHIDHSNSDSHKSHRLNMVAISNIDRSSKCQILRISSSQRRFMAELLMSIHRHLQLGKWLQEEAWIEGRVPRLVPEVRLTSLRIRSSRHQDHSLKENHAFLVKDLVANPCSI